MNNEMSRGRLAVINLLTVTLLLTLVARLFYIQVLAAPEARRGVEQTSLRLIYTPAPRGFIFDRNAEPLGRNRTAVTVAMDVSRLPKKGEARDRMLAKLAAILGMTETAVQKVVDDSALGFYEPRQIATDVPMDKVVYLLEHQEEFPGINADEVPIREYPNGSLLAHSLGHVGKLSAEEYKVRIKDQPQGLSRDARQKRYRPDDQIGKIGIEKVYEKYLRGVPGVRKISVNVRGELVDEISDDPPQRGWDAVLTIDDAVQKAAEDALRRGTELAQRLTDPATGLPLKAPAGAVVALDPNNGEVLGLASFPTFNPNDFVGPTSREVLAQINDPESHTPMFNRAIAEQVGPASTFKPMTLAAAWEANLVTPEQTFNCPGYFQVGNRRFKDWDPKGHGQVGLTRSLVESCDVVYYTLGVKMNESNVKEQIGEHLQETARKFGMGAPTGIDLLGERPGLVPDAKWKEEHFRDARPFDRRWFPGDAANLAIGQGFLQVTPLQLAVAYSALANGGQRYRPHLLKCLAKLDLSNLPSDLCTNPGAMVPETAKPEVLGEVGVNASALEFISKSLSGAVVDKGTAAAAFSGFPLGQVSVAAKTGTAQVAQRQNFSWFAAFAPAENPQIVVVALVEEAGTGAQIAAPIVRRVLEAKFGLPAGNFEAGARAD